METAAATGRARARGHAPLERVVVPVRFALLRLRRRWPQALAAALGVAAGAAVLALTVVGSAAVQDRALQQALAQLQPSDRAIEAVWSGVPAQSNLSFPRLDAVARARTTSILGRPPFRVVVFRQATWGGVFVNLGAVDGLRRWLTLERGRLPTRCTPTDCELVQIGGAPAQPKLPFLHVVGRAAFTAGAPLQAYFGAGNGKGPPILLADGVLPFVRTPLPDAALIARTYGWIVPVEPRRVHDWQLASLDDRLNRAQSALERASDIFTVAAPTDTIAAARATSRVAAQRLLILGGDAAVLLLGFAVLASTRLRRDHAEVRRRLSWSGARGSQLLLVAVTEVAGLTAVATVVGWAAGSAAGALLSRHLGSPGGAVVAHSILTTRTLGLALGLGAVTAATMLVALRADELALGGLRVTAADAAALGALAAVLLALARGKADTAALQHSGTGVVLLMLPALVLFVLAVATARVLGPVLRGLERLARPSPPTLRVAILSLARSPGDVMLTVVFFVLSVGIAVFAFGYRATLLQGERQQALYAVPAPYVLTEDLTKLVTVEQALPHGGTPVLRDSGYTSGTAGRDFTLLALPPRALAAIDGWRTDFSPRSPAQLASLLRPPATPRLRTILRLDVARTATLRFTTTGDMVGVSAVVADRRGDFTTLLLGEHGAGRHAATVRVPPEARGGRIVAFRVSFPVTASYVAAHRAAETSHTVNDASVGSIRFAGWAGTHRFVVNNGADAILRPREPLEGEPVPVVASPALAAAADASGIVPLHVENETVPARIVATARYFPSVDGDLVVADLGTWLAAANTADPGTATPSELWRTTAPPRGTPLDVASQRAAEQSLADDPLARGAIALLLVTAVVGLVLAAVGVLLTVLGDLRDERGALFDLSAQGSTPSELRRHLLVRAGAVASLGLVAGAAAGAIVAALVVAVVTVSAGAQQALPPLLLAFDWPLAAAALGAAAIGAAGSAALAVRRLR